ncbi:unnamed protein product [Bemisia tabaci]|uniref:Chitin-binding type-2 domain-containing protein n=1 Tax=Bemisia tabaci TaxID=7038 RepID=A0A9P0ADQ0_BEMTA|nr:unnamed protein product [Bemisia tabaci]
MNRTLCALVLGIWCLGTCAAAAKLPFLYEIERPEVYHQVKPVAAPSTSSNVRPTLPKCDTKYRNGTYPVMNPVFCDQFYYCDNGKIKAFQCDDGFAYTPYKGCKLVHTVDCSKRPRLQIPRGTEPCRRRNEIRADPAGCGRFVVCENNKASLGRCPPQQSFDDVNKTCRAQTNEDRVNCAPQLPPRPVEAPKPNRTDIPSIVVPSVPDVVSAVAQSALQVINLIPSRPLSISFQTSRPATSQELNLTERPSKPSPAVQQPQHTETVQPTTQLPTTLRPPASVSAEISFSSHPLQSAPQTPIGCPSTPCDPALSNWRCPEETYLQFGDHARYPYLDSCDKFIICYRDRSYRVAGCEAGRVFNRLTKVCVPRREIPSCSGTAR